MVELPGEGDARAIAHFVTSTRMAWLENRQLSAVLRKLETQYAGLVRRYEANLAKQQENLADTQSELRRLQDHQDAIATQVGTLAVEGKFTAWPKQSDGRGRHLTPEASESEDAVDEQLGVASAVRNDFATETAASPSWISSTGLPSEPSVRFAALQIARSLDKTRREALRTKLERIFTIDVETRLLGEVLGSKLFQLDPALELSLVTASSEVINERSGRIRFFPDGTSTGGRIQVQHDREGATVKVDWSTGVVTVQVNGD
jgi:general secretion pathway protein H